MVVAAAPIDPAQIELARARAYHFRKAAALCSMAARLLVDRAAAGRLSAEDLEGGHEASSIGRFLLEQLSQLDQAALSLRSSPSDASTVGR